MTGTREYDEAYPDADAVLSEWYGSVDYRGRTPRERERGNRIMRRERRQRELEQLGDTVRYVADALTVGFVPETTSGREADAADGSASRPKEEH